MGSIDGLYSEIGAIIKEKENEERLAISVEQVVDEVRKRINVYSASIDWYIETALKSAVSTVLNQNGYRSVVKGNGMFVNPDICSKPEYMAKMVNNAMLEERQKEQIVEMLTKKTAEQGIDGQLSWDPTTGLIVEDFTIEKLMEMLKKDAGII